MTKELDNRILFVAATHGDEGFSIDALDQLEADYAKDEYGYDWIIGNPIALAENVRFIDTDLNRCAPGNVDSDLYEERRASQLIRISDDYGELIDIHGTTANTGIFTLVTYPSIENILFAASLPIDRVVFWYSNKSQIKGPLTQFCSQPAIEIECGPKGDLGIIIQLRSILSMFLQNRKNGLKIDLDNKEFYAVYGAIKQWQGDRLSDFELVTQGSEDFYPLLVGQYSDKICYKMRKVDFAKQFIY